MTRCWLLLSFCGHISLSSVKKLHNPLLKPSKNGSGIYACWHVTARVAQISVSKAFKLENYESWGSEVFSRTRKRTQGSAFLVLFQTVDFSHIPHFFFFDVNFKVMIYSPYSGSLKLPFYVRKWTWVITFLRRSKGWRHLHSQVSFCSHRDGPSFH